jgi:hypothetical protein
MDRKGSVAVLFNQEPPTPRGSYIDFQQDEEDSYN